MRVLFLGLNYAPERISTGVYSAGLCEDLVRRGHEVHAVVGKPYYPEWRIYDEYRGGGARRSVEQGVTIVRVPHYVPARPSGAKRMLHHASFALNAAVPALRAARRLRPQLVIAVAPALIAAPVALLAAKVSGAKSWVHIQDFEVEAAVATGLLRPANPVVRWGLAFERAVLRGFDHVSTISHEMLSALERKGLARERIVQIRNWADLSRVQPLARPFLFREQWGITTPHVALYSGNIANKQGIEILVETARLFAADPRITFVICGNGPNRANLERLATGLENLRFHDLQPVESLNELVNLATIHLLPQKAEAADLVLPSKLTNMLASGRPVIATAAEGSGLAREIADCGLLVPPGSAEALAGAITSLIEDDALREQLGAAARQRALSAWNRDAILDGFEARAIALVAGDEPSDTTARSTKPRISGR